MTLAQHCTLILVASYLKAYELKETHSRRDKIILDSVSSSDYGCKRGSRGQALEEAQRESIAAIEKYGSILK